MRTADLIGTMESFVGIKEEPDGSNKTPIGEEYGWNGVPWCAETVSVAANRHGFPLKEAAVRRIEARARAGDFGMGWSETAVVGSAVIFDFGGQYHTGIVYEVLDGTRFRTIEGNYKNRCAHVLRDMKYVRGFATFPFGDETPAVDPAPASDATSGTYESDPLLRQGATGAIVRYLQKIISEKAGGRIAVDGIFGSETESRVKEVQRAFSIEQDGVVGPQTWSVLHRLEAGEPFPTSVFGNWPHEGKPLVRRRSTGDAVAYLQRVISLKAGGDIAVDGNFGPQTEGRVRTVQKHNGIAIDGIVGPQTWGVIDRLALS